MEGIRKAMNERNLNEGQWEDRKQWSLGVGQCRTMFWNQHTYIHTYIHTFIKCDAFCLSPANWYWCCLSHPFSYCHLHTSGNWWWEWHHHVIFEHDESDYDSTLCDLTQHHFPSHLKPCHLCSATLWFLHCLRLCFQSLCMITWCVLDHASLW